MTARGLADPVVDLGEHATGRASTRSPRGGHDLRAGAPQQPHAERVLQSGQGARHGGLRHPEPEGGVGEAPGVGDGDQAAQVPQLHIHASSV